jgi:formylmethanofuran dehydrogenase subunit A
MTVVRIAGGVVYDPANGIDGEVRDICIADGRVVDDVPPDATTIDARGMVVMPGGVDIHAHVASSSVNVARRLLPEERDADPVRAPLLDEGVPRSGTGGTMPSSFSTGYRYAGLGYTTVFDAAVAPLHARASHAEFDDTPIVDGGFFVLLGNDEYLIRQIDAGERERAREYAAWMLGAAGAYAIKIVNPGGIERWKRGDRDRTEFDTPIGSSRVTPRAILDTLVDTANTLRLPHAAHIHCNNLGIPGNIATTLESMRATSGRRAHFTHLQFHSYAMESGKTGGWRSGARELIEYINTHRETSGDVGQVLFGPATTLTADGPVEYMLYKSTGRKWVNVDIELETGCGIVPYTYEEKSAVSALQWVIGLELFLLSADPWRVVLSTDHPNGGSFAAYPELIRLLMDRTYRDDQLKRVNHKFLAGSALADGLSREYTLNEIAIVTRAGPARLLGLHRKGHLGAGADADVTVYTPDADRSRMFATPRYVVKGGALVVEEGQLRRAPAGRRLHVRPTFDASVERDLRRYFDQYATVSFDNYPVGVLADEPQPL